MKSSKQLTKRAFSPIVHKVRWLLPRTSRSRTARRNRPRPSTRSATSPRTSTPTANPTRNARATTSKTSSSSRTRSTSTASSPNQSMIGSSPLSAPPSSPPSQSPGNPNSPILGLARPPCPKPSPAALTAQGNLFVNQVFRINRLFAD